MIMNEKKIQRKKEEGSRIKVDKELRLKERLQRGNKRLPRRKDPPHNHPYADPCLSSCLPSYISDFNCISRGTELPLFKMIC